MNVTYAVDARTVADRFPGIGRYTTNLLRALAGVRRADERILYLCSEQQRERLDLEEEAGLAWAPCEASPFGIEQQWQIPGLLRKWRAAVYHSPYYLMPYWPGCATVLTVYDLIPKLFPKYVSLQARLLFEVTTRMALRSAARVIAISEATQRDYQQLFGVPEENMSVIPLAAAPQFRPAPETDIEKVRALYGIEGAYVLYVGSNKPHKNLAGLLSAWEMLEADVRGTYTLVIAGRRDSRYVHLEEEIRRLAQSTPLRVLADVDDKRLPALYSGATLFVFPSFYEGFGLPVLEAMACGCVVACSERSSLPEVAGRAAILFDPTKPAHISQLIGELLRDAPRRQALRESALRRAAAFSWQRTAAETIDIYRRLGARQRLYE